VSVTDNGPDSALNARHLLELVVRPRPGDPLLELIGFPNDAGPVFPQLPDPQFFRLDQLTDEHRALLEVMQHYVVLNYPPGTPLAEVAARIRGDARFAFAHAVSTGSFLLTPNDPYFPLPWPPQAHDTRYQWGLQASQLNLPGAWARNTGWAHVGVLDSGLPTQAAPSFNPPWTVVHADLQDVIAANLSWDFFRNNGTTNDIHWAAPDPTAARQRRGCRPGSWTASRATS